MHTDNPTIDKQRVLADLQTSIASAISGSRIIRDDLLSYLLEMANEQLKKHISGSKT